MKLLYLKIIELLTLLEEFQYIDLNIGQLHEEKPPITYPAALIKINIPSAVENQHLFIEKMFTFQITIVSKFYGETNALAPGEVREKSLYYFDLCEKVTKALQGYNDGQYDAFSFVSATDADARKGLKTIVVQFRTSLLERIANS